MKVFFLPISYLLGYLIIKGFTSSSYSAKRDLYAILLLMIPLYIDFLMIANMIRHQKNKKVCRKVVEEISASFFERKAKKLLTYAINHV